MSVSFPLCGDVPYGPQHGGAVKGCRSELVIVPDADGKGHTICCPSCDKVNFWPRLIQAGRNHA